MAVNLGTAWIQISPSMKGFASSVGKELASIDPSPASERIHRGLSGAFGTVAKVGVGAMGAVAASAAAIGTAVGAIALKGGIERSLNIEQAQAKLTGLGHSTSEVAGLMDTATRAVKGTQYSLDSAATVAAQFSAAGVQGGDAMASALSTVADTAQISGRSMEDIGTIFSSVAAKGKLDGEDMLQLTSAGVPVLQFLSDQLGVTTADVSDMVSKGQIDFETFSSAMQAGLGGAAQAAGGTFSGALANVKAALSRLGASAAAPALDALRILFVGLIPVIDSITTAIQPAMDALGPQLAAAAQAAVGSFGSLGDVLGQSLAAAMPAVTQALVSLIGLLPQIIAAVGQLMPVLIQAAASVLPVIVQAVTALMPVVVQIIGVVAQLLPPLIQIITAILPVIVQLITALMPVIMQIIGAVVQLLPPLIQLITAILPVVIQLITALMPVVTTVVGVILQVVTGVIGSVLTFVTGVITGIRTAVEAVAAWFSTWLLPALQAVWAGIQAGVSALGAVFGAIWEGIKIAVAVAVTAMQPLWDGMVFAWQNVIAPALTWLWHTVFEPVWNGIRAAVEAVANWFTGVLVPVLQGAWNAISSAVGWLRDRFSEIWNYIRDGIVAPVVNWFADHVVSRFVAVKDNVVSAFNTMRDGIGAAWDAVKEIAARPVRFVVNTVVAGIVEAYNKVASKFGAAEASVPHVDFAVGGYTGPGGRLQPAGVVHRGEVVWSQRDVARWGGPAVVDAMRRWRGYDSGGVVGLKGAFGGHDLGTMRSTSVTDILKGLLSGPVDFFKGLIGDLLDGLGGAPFIEAVKNVPRRIAEIVGDWVKRHLSDLFGGGSGSEAFDRWWEAAVAIIPEMAPYKAIAARVAQMESGFNPTVVNNWDSNAAAGHPSAGLMQFIQPTFAAYHHPGFDNWMGAVDQLLAWWHYVNARYGGPMNIPGIVSMSNGGGYVGYAGGTRSARRGLAWVGEDGPELIQFRGGEQVVPNDRLGRLGSPTYVFSPTYRDDGRGVRRDMEDWRFELGRALA